MLCVSCERWSLSFGTSGFGISEFFLSLSISVITRKGGDFMILQTISHSVNLVLSLTDGGSVVIEITNPDPIDFYGDWSQMHYKIGDNITGGRFRTMWASYTREGSFKRYISKYLERHGFDAVSVKREMHSFDITFCGRGRYDNHGYLTFTKKENEPQVLLSYVELDRGLIDERHIELDLRDHAAVLQAAKDYIEKGGFLNGV